MSSDYSENFLIEQPAIEIFKSLDYTHRDCFHETFGENGTLGRGTSSNVVLIPKLKEALVKINILLPAETIDKAIEEVTRDRGILSSVNANREIYKLLRDGVKVKVRCEDGTDRDETVKVIDFNDPTNNDFFLASQFWVTGEMYKRRADLVGFVNGLPLIFIELKAVHRKLENAFRDNLTDYKDTIPQIFWYNAFIILSNGSESRIGTVSADFEHFNDWKKINSEGEEGVISLETIIRGTCEKHRFVDLLENFILYKDSGGTLTKIVAKNHQHLGVNNAIESFKKLKENQGKLGVFWHTQGSGKSFSMIFFSQKILRKFEGNYTFLIVTDRKELDDQIYKNFASVGAVTEQEVHAETRDHLKQLLRGNHRNIFTLIQKFGTEAGEEFPRLSDRADIIVITDEAHRSQYDTLAMNMRTALPNAAFIAFTGTPLIIGEELTRKTFGDYVSIYNFKQSIDDNATVPLYYENRIPEVQLSNENLNEDLERVIEEAILSPDQEEKLQREFAREYHIITRDDRLEKIAGDIVAHFISRGYQGKAMVVSIDKPTAVKMYDKVQQYWNKYIRELRERLSGVVEGRDALIDRLAYLEETDMAVVVSGEQNEIDRFRKMGLDIEKHRRRMVKEDLAEKFKDPDNPFRIVFVCAMWMTGFDVPSLSTIYLDKPMRNHTLMQTIARANRVFGEKANGLIVDYVGVFRELQKALAIYGSGPRGGVKEGETPVRPKAELVVELEKAIAEAEVFCAERGIYINGIIRSDKLEKIRLITDSVDAILVNDESKRRYILLSSSVKKLFKAILPDPEAKRFYEKYALFSVLADKIISLSGEVDITDVMRKVEYVLDKSIEAEGYVISELPGEHIIDLSMINFDALRKKFLEGKKNIQIAQIKRAISMKLNKMVRLNKSRMDYLERFQQLIDDYNSGAINTEIFFDQLLAFVNKMNEEEKRGIQENLSEEELALFDLIRKPDLTKNEIQQVKLAAKDLLNILKEEKLVLDWRKKQQARAEVLYTIETALDDMLPRTYTPELYQQTCNISYQHIYESYFGAGQSIYT